MAEYFNFLGDWSEREQSLFEDAFEPIGAFNDPTAQALFDNAYFNRDVTGDDRAAIRDALRDYIMDEYGYDFNEIFDWKAWREAYGEAA